MVFGQDPAASSAPPKGPNQTMVFGVQPTKPPPPAAPKHQTMIFGGGQHPPAPAPAPNPPANQTMMFGGPSVAPPPAPNKAAQTMVFGTPAGQQQTSSPPAAATGPNQTMVFGASPVVPSAAPNQTAIFGTPAGQQAASREPPPKANVPNQTLVFGGTPAAPPSAKNTVMFGTSAGQQAASAQPPSSAPANQTLVFGATPVSAPPPRSTQAYGTQQPSPPQPVAAKNQTMMFGKPPEAVAPPNRTLAFGAPKIDRAPEADLDVEPAPRSESTVRVDLEQMMRQHEGEGLAMETEPESPEAVQARHDRTNLFAMSSMQETTKPDGKAPQSTSGTAPELSRKLSLDGAETLPPNLTSEEFFGSDDRQPDPDPPGVSTLLEPGGLDSRSTIKHDGPIASTLPNLNPVERATDIAHRSELSLDLLASETPNTSPDGAAPKTAELNDEAAAAIASSGRRRVVVAVLVIFLLLLAGAAFVGWQYFGKQFFVREVDPKLQQEVLQAVERFREDDTGARKAELAMLEELVKANPSYADAHAALVLGLALELDDLNGEHAFLKVRYEALTALLASLPKDDAKRGPLAKRINGFATRSGELSPLITTTWQRLSKAGAGLEGVASEPSPQVSRALHLLKAVRGEPITTPLPDDYWGKLVPSIAALNSKAGPEQLKKALDGLEPLLTAEGTSELPRPHLLAARLYLALKDEAKSKEAVELAAKYGPKLTVATAAQAALQD